MPAPAGTKRVRGVQIYRPFTYGSEAIPFDPENRPKDAPPDHTHRREVQVARHVRNSVRMIESPPFEVEEMGWGECEIAIKFYFAPESGEKPQQIWHGLKLHPYYGNVEQQKRDKSMISSVCYEEVLFDEPIEAFYGMLTGAEKEGKEGKAAIEAPPTTEIPARSSGSNKFSREEEAKESDRMGEAVKQVQQLVAEEKAKLVKKEARLQELEKTEGKPIKKK
ncbi:hypothetical protein PV11_08602 [Exophiala sideris]|uniref:Protein AF-9 homolog n=1 Tax=Exophiala sideris TaxID=1016849 RepID=A0A0D1VXU1_9EURO|nr:hypothetical protein PV11_08602 [Exophiala sideris]